MELNNFKVGFDKIQTNKSDGKEEVKITFTGVFNNLDCKVVISGDVNDVNEFTEGKNLKRFGQRMSVGFSNDQASLDDNGGYTE